MNAVAANEHSTDEPVTTKHLAEILHEVSKEDIFSGETLQRVLRVVAELTGAFGVIFLDRDSENRLRIDPGNLTPKNLTLLRSLLQTVARLSAVAAAEGTPQASKTEANGDLFIVAVPVLGANGGAEALAAAVSADSEQQARAKTSYLSRILLFVAAYLSAIRNGQPTGDHRIDDQKLHETMLAIAENPDDVQLAYRRISEWAKESTNCQQIVLGIKPAARDQCRIVHYAGFDSFNERSEQVSVLRELLDETVIASTEEGIQSDLLQTQASEKLRRDSGMVVTQRQLLRNAANEITGVLLGLSPNGTKTSPMPLDAVRPLGNMLQLIQANEPKLISRLLGKASTRWYKQPILWCSAGLLAAMMFIPVPLKVKTNCVVQPQQRRFVSVPYDGRLEEALVEPGEIVQKGKMLAKMDGQDIQWQISGLRADLKSAQKKRDASLAERETSSAQIAALEAERLRIEIEELQQRLSNLEIRSPVDGVIISGDPQRLEGSRFAMGDTLLEVAPLSKMVVELEIPDEDISHVRAGQSVRYRLSSAPLQTFEGRIRSLYPRSEMRENENVFVALVDLDNEQDAIRPGMRGRARVTADRHLLGWNLFHKAWDSLVTRIAW